VPKRLAFQQHCDNRAPSNASCDGDPINESKIQADLNGKTLGDVTFGDNVISRVTIENAAYRKERTELTISVECVQHVRRRPGWVGERGKCRLAYGCEGGAWVLQHVHVLAVEDLMSCEIENIRKTAGYPFFVAVDQGDVTAVKAYIKEGVNVYRRCRKGETALMIAARRGHMDVAKTLIKAGIPVDAPTPNGRTALMIASSVRQTEMVSLLLREGADPNYPGPLGYTALMLALEERLGIPKATEDSSLSILEDLLKKGANVNVSDDRQVTPLWIAIRNKNRGAVQLLLDNGADVNKRAGPNGHTPLMTAIESGHLAIVESLVNHGADVNAKVKDVTPMVFARTCDLGWQEKAGLIHILKRAGAKE
jgi:ankyrin repeat protein